MAYKPARPGSEGNTRLLAQYGGGSKGPRQSYATGGAVSGNPALDEGMEAAPIAKTGEKSKSGKKDRGGKKDAKTNVNVVIMSKPDAAPPMPGPSGMVPPGPPMPPPGPPMGGPPGGPPMPMRAHGGRVKREDISAKDAAAKQRTMGTSPGKLAKGGSVCRAVGGPVKAPTTKGIVAEKGFQAGGGGAAGRLEKIKAFGKKG